MPPLSSVAKLFNKRSIITYGLLAAGGAADYNQRKKEGEKPSTALVKTAANQFLWYLYPGPMMALTAAPFIAAGGAALEARKQESARTMMGSAQTFGPRDVLDNAYLATNRSRAMAAINQSKLNARNIIGQEAGLMSARYSGAGSIMGAGYNSFYRASY